MASTNANLMKQKEEITLDKRLSTPTGLAWYTKIAAISLFWNTTMVAGT